MKGIVLLGCLMTVAVLGIGSLPVLAGGETSNTEVSLPVLTKDKSIKEKGSNRPVIGNIKGKPMEGAGCYFKTLSNYRRQKIAFVFASTLGEEEGGFMNIDGQDIKLNFVRQLTNKKGEWTTFYKNSNIKVRMDFVLVEQNNEESIYNATITVSRNKLNSRIRVKGSCGC